MQDELNIKTFGISVQSQPSTNRGGRAFWVKSADALAKDSIVATIPKTAILSPSSSTLAKELAECEIGGPLALTIAFLYESFLGDKSKWAGYIKSLPDWEPLPLYWFFASKHSPDTDRPDDRPNNEALDESTLNDASSDGNVTLDCDFEAESGGSGHTPLKRRKLAHATHKQSKQSVAQSSSVFLQALENTELSNLVDEFSLLQQDYDTTVVEFLDTLGVGYFKSFATFEKFLYASTIIASRCFEVDVHHGCALVPLADLFNHSSTRETINLESDFFANQSAGPDAEGTPEEDDVIELRVVRACEAGEEVFNTYGKHSNSYLLMKYGFCEADNPFGVVSFSMDDVVSVIGEAVDLDDAEERVSWWMQRGYHLAVRALTDAEAEGDNIASKEDDSNSAYATGKEASNSAHVAEKEAPNSVYAAEEEVDDASDHENESSSGENSSDHEYGSSIGDNSSNGEEEDDEPEDYFQVTMNGVDGKLKLFLWLMLHVSKKEFSKWSSDDESDQCLTMAFDDFRDLVIDAGDLSEPMRGVLSKLARKRLSRYPSLAEDCLGISKYPRILRECEISILTSHIAP